MESVGSAVYTVEAQSSITKEFRVKVLARDGRPVPNVSVFFDVFKGKANLSDSTIRTNADGIAEVAVTAGPEMQTVVTQAFVPALENPYVQFSIEIVPQLPAAIKLISGDQQEAVTQTALADYLKVKVVDAFGNAVENVRVDFSITSGNGSIDSDLSRINTDKDGIAYLQFVAGTEPVSQVTASMSGNFSVAFTVFSLQPVTMTKVASGLDATKLSWTKPANSTFAQYVVMRAPANTSYYTEVFTITDEDVTTFFDETADIGRIYSYKIRVVSDRGNHVDSEYANGQRGKWIELKSETDFSDVAIAHDKSVLYVVLPLSMRLLMIDTDTFEKTDSIDLQTQPHAVAVSVDKTKLYVALYGLPRFQVFDIASKTMLKEVDISDVISANAITDLYVASNGQLFASSYNGYVARIDVFNNYAARRVASDEFFSYGAPRFIATSGNYLYMEESLLTPNSLFKLDISSADAPIVGEDVHGSVYGTRGCALSPDGKLMYLTSGLVVSTSTMKPIDQLNGPLIYSLQITNQKLIGCFYGGAFEQWKLDQINLSTQKVDKSFKLGFNCSALYISADESTVFLVSVPMAPDYLVRVYKVNL